jgi:hypothetical protein
VRTWNFTHQKRNPLCIDLLPKVLGRDAEHICCKIPISAAPSLPALIALMIYRTLACKRTYVTKPSFNTFACFSQYDHCSHAHSLKPTLSLGPQLSTACLERRTDSTFKQKYPLRRRTAVLICGKQTSADSQFSINFLVFCLILLFLVFHILCRI